MGVVFFSVCEYMCVRTRVRKSSHAAFLTQLGGSLYACECCLYVLYEHMCAQWREAPQREEKEMLGRGGLLLF